MGRKEIEATRKKDERATRAALRKQRRDQERAEETQDDFANFENQLKVRSRLNWKEMQGC